MKNEFRSGEAFKVLRQKAEQLLEENGVVTPDLDGEDLVQLTHELEVHYVELEVQNEELGRTRRQLQASRDEYFDLYESAPIAYVTLNEKGIVERANKAARRMLKGTGKFFLGSSFLAWIHKEDLSKYFPFMETLARSQEAGPVEMRVRGKNDVPVYVHMEATAGVDIEPGQRHYRLALVDITERKEAESALKRNEEHLRLSVEGGRLGTWERDLVTDETFWNRHLYDLLGRVPNSPVTGETFFKYIHKDDLPRVREHVEKAYRSRTEFVEEFRIVREDGQVRWLAAFARLYRDDTGEPIRMAGVNLDITERKHLEEELRRSRDELERRVKDRTRQLESVNEALREEVKKRIEFEKDLRESTKKVLSESKRRRFLSARLVDTIERDRREVAMYLHDQIGQMLATLKMDLEFFRQGYEKGKAPSSESLIETEKKVAGIMGGLREVSRRLRPDVLDSLGLLPALRSLVDSFREQVGIEVHFDYKELFQKIEADKSLAVYRILQEALNNIGKHAQAKEIFISLVPKADSLQLTVEDDGVGFNYKEMVTDSEAIGEEPLGLMIMKERAMLAGGELRVESEIGNGTQVIAEIPID
ncbi:MAG: PAS domain S-box protein [Desulfatiglandaceae bacterium]